jgi:CO/xanthine dehydrogenase FAD-binding subunit
MIDERRFLDLKAEGPLQLVFEAPGSPEVLRRTLAGSLTWQQRNEITLRKALRSPAQAPVWVAALLAWGATVVCEGEERFLSDFLLRGGTQPLLEALRVPLDHGNRTWGESHVGRSPADLPIVAAVAVVDWTDGLVQAARLALTGVWPEPARLAPSSDMLIGGRLDDEQLGRVVSAVQQEVSPPDDFLGGKTYRREMASVLTRRALERCREEYHG